MENARTISYKSDCYNGVEWTRLEVLLKGAKNRLTSL